MGSREQVGYAVNSAAVFGSVGLQATAFEWLSALHLTVSALYDSVDENQLGRSRMSGHRLTPRHKMVWQYCEDRTIEFDHSMNV